MLDRIGRSLKDAMFQPLERTVPSGVSPDMITWASLVPGLVAAVCATFSLWGWAFSAFVVNRILDGLDGMVARRRDCQSDYGGYLDIMVDFVVYATIPIGVWLGVTGRSVAAGQSSGVLPLVVLLSVFYINAASWMYLSAVLERRRAVDRGRAEATRTQVESTSVTMPAGVVEGTETVIFFALFLLIPKHYAILFWIMTVGTAAGVGQRLVWARRSIR